MFRKSLILFFIVAFVFLKASATHNRAGEITYRHINGFTFEFTVTTYTYIYSAANRSELSVDWGDGSSSSIDIVAFQNYPSGHVPIANTDYYHNIYIGTHTFPGSGIYEILMEDPNRNLGVKNIPNSVNTIFSIKTIMLVESSVGANNTPVLLNPPIDKAARGHIFIHNPSAYDPDGDSISYTLTTCLGLGGEPIEGYTYPPASDTLLINEYSGDLIWNTPMEVGIYNVAMLVEEWRKEVRIGRIERDMQINVYDSDNNPPVNPEIKDICIVAGDSIEMTFTSTDADGDSVMQSISGGPFEVSNPASFILDSAGLGFATSTFKWVTDCSNARQQPYYLVLKSEDVNDDIQLVDITSFSIKVLHPAIENLTAIPGYDTIRLDWDIPTCSTPSGYKIYRSLDSYGYIPDSCEVGVPEYTGFTLFDIVKGADKNWYKDDNHGEGLVPGYDYCYMVTAYYDDGAENIASAEVCTTLVAGTPPILKVSVSSDDENNGSIDLGWAMPQGIDTIDDGPYRYEIIRKAPDETDYKTITTIETTDLSDTTFTDTGINTLVYPYTYSIILWYYEDGVWHELLGNEFASSQYIDVVGSDNMLTLNMKKRTPWLNTQYEIYRRTNDGDPFVNVGSTVESIYKDSSLVNNIKYTYRTIGSGMRPLFGSIYQVENNSHLASGTPVDTIPPCPPELIVTSDCSDLGVVDSLTWSTPDSCIGEEIVAYKVYYKNTLDGPFTLLDSLSPNIFSYTHIPDSSIEGYYAVTAIDSSNNETDIIPYYTIAVCGYYKLPNVFTPNNDKVNDLFRAYNKNNYIKKVDMTIYNRYGKVVYKTNDPYINWDGKNMDSKRLVSTGVYYYICDVYEPLITGTVVRNLTGFIHVYPGDENDVSE